MTQRKPPKPTINQQAEEESFHLLFANHPIPMLVYDVKTLAFLDVNDAALEKYGYTRAEFLTLTIKDIRPTDDVTHLIKKLKQIRPVLQHSGEWRHRLKNGQVIEVEITSHTLDYEGHKAALVMAQDITERKRVEETLKRNEEIFRLFVTYSPAAIAMFDRSMKYIVASKHYLVDYGLSEQDLIGRSHYEIFPEIPERWKEIHRRCLAGSIERCEEDPFPRADGKLDWVKWEIRPWHETTGEIGGIILFSEVITEQKQMEEKLKESLSLLRIAEESAKLGGWSFDLEKNSILWSDEVAAIHETPAGFSPSVEEGISFYASEGRERINKVFNECVQNGISYNEELEIITAKGKRVWVQTTGEAVRDDKGKIIKVHGAFQDITARKHTEQKLAQYSERLEEMVEERTSELQETQEQLVRQEKLAVLGQMAGSVGHELRNPLTVINNAIYFLKLVGADKDQKVKEYLGIIEAETHTAEKIITDMLDFARVKSVEFEAVSVPELIRQTLERFPAPSSVKVTLDIPEILPTVYVDPRQVTQVLGNLIVNACQSMISVSLAELLLLAQAQGPMMSIAVRDTGVGIPPENMQKLFEPLFTTKAKGIGLGLAVSQKLAEANGGRIEVQSEPGAGSTFTLWLPITAGQISALESENMNE